MANLLEEELKEFAELRAAEKAAFKNVIQFPGNAKRTAQQAENDKEFQFWLLEESQKLIDEIAELNRIASLFPTKKQWYSSYSYREMRDKKNLLDDMKGMLMQELKPEGKYYTDQHISKYFGIEPVKLSR